MLSGDLAGLDRCYPCNGRAVDVVGFVRAHSVGVLVGVCVAHRTPGTWPSAALAGLSDLLTLAEWRARPVAAH